MPSKEENKLIKRTKILDAAYELFSKNGMNMTPIDDVVKKAGVAKGTFYLYFKDKFDLTDQIVLNESTKIVKSVIDEVQRQAAEKDLEVIEQVLLFTDMIIDYMAENREITVLINSKLSGMFQLLISDQSPEIRENIDCLVQMLVDVGETEDQARKHLYVASNMVVTVCCEAILTGSPYSIEEIRPEVHNIIKKLLINQE